MAPHQCKGERHLSSWITMYSMHHWVISSWFLVSLTTAIFICDFYATDEASLRLLNVFLPDCRNSRAALAMRSWPDGVTTQHWINHDAAHFPVGNGNREVLVSFWSWCTLSFTFPFAITVNCLGTQIWCCWSYFAATLLLALYYSISLLAASITREPIGAFVWGFQRYWFFFFWGCIGARA